MSESEGAQDRKLSRRRFLKWAGALAVVGAAGVELGAAAKSLVKGSGSRSRPAGSSLRRAAAPKIVTDDDAVVRGRIPSGVDAGSAVGTAPAENGFSVFWITDTQFLSETNPALYRMMNNWIVDNWAAYNGKLVVHTGDVVQDGNVEQEFENANDAMGVLIENNIPYLWCAGNHDDLVEGDQTSGWNGNFWGSPAFDPVAAAKYVNGLPNVGWVSDYHLGMNTAVSFYANGFSFLVVCIEWNASPDVLAWAESIIDDPTYADHMVIVAPHAYIDSSGSDDDARWGTTLQQFIAGLVEILDSHENIFLTLNGHFATDMGYNTPSPISGRNQLMFDRQDCCDYPNDPTGRGIDNTDDSTSDTDKVGGATVTILNFDTDHNTINVSTYDVFTGQWRVDYGNQYSVVLFPNPPSGVEQLPPYQNVGVPSYAS